MLSQRFERRRSPSAVVLHQRHEAPQRRRYALPRAVVVELARVHELAVARQRPVGLAIADAGLGRAVQEIEVGHVKVDALGAHPVVQLGYLAELVPLRVGQALVVRMRGRGADVARIGAVVLEAAHARTLEEGAYLVEVLVSPVAAQAGRAAEGHAAAVSRLGVDNVHLVAYPAARQKRVAPHLDALAAGIVDQLAELGRVGLRDILGVGTRAKAEDDHLIARLGTLVNGRAHGFGVARREVQENGVLRRPRSHRTVETAREEPLALAVEAVEGHLVDAERREGLPRRHGLVGSQRRRDVKYAARLHQVVALRRIGRVLDPLLGDVGLLLREAALAVVVALDVDVGQQEGVGVAAARRLGLGKGQVLEVERIDIKRHGRTVHHLHALADDGNLVIYGEMHLHRHIRQHAAAAQREYYLAPRGILLVQRPAVARPLERGAYLADLEILHHERVGDGLHLPDPLGLEICPLGLSRKAADRPPAAVDCDETLAADGAQHALARHAVGEVRRGQVGEYAQRARHHAVGHDDALAVGGAVDTRLRALGREQPVVGRAVRGQALPHGQRRDLALEALHRSLVLSRALARGGDIGRRGGLTAIVDPRRREHHHVAARTVLRRAEHDLQHSCARQVDIDPDGGLAAADRAALEDRLAVGPDRNRHRPRVYRAVAAREPDKPLAVAVAAEEQLAAVDQRLHHDIGIIRPDRRPADGGLRVERRGLAVERYPDHRRGMQHHVVALRRGRAVLLPHLRHIHCGHRRPLLRRSPQGKAGESKKRRRHRRKTAQRPRESVSRGRKTAHGRHYIPYRFHISLFFVTTLS